MGTTTWTASPPPVCSPDCLTRLGGRVRSYIPDRLEEGYGLNQEAVLHLAQQGVTLIITVDCGITAAREVEFARELGD